MSLKTDHITHRIWRRLVHGGFQLLYNEMAWTYDVVSWLVSLGEWRKWQEAALPFVEGGRVLEIAHGPGHMLLRLARSERYVTGIDLSPYMGRLAARRLRHAGLPANLVRCKVQALPFQAHAFDTVISTFPTGFMTESVVMEAVYRLLRPDGRYVIVPEGHLTGGGVLQRFIEWLYLITGQREGVFAVNEEPSAPTELARWRWFLQAMQETGFEIKVRQITLTRSSATVIVATRRGK